MTSTTFPPAASLTLVHLFRGVIDNDRDPKLWNSVLNYRALIRDYVRVLGLELFVDEAEGYAFLRQGIEELEDAKDEEKLPQLIRRTQLSFHMTVLVCCSEKSCLRPTQEVTTRG